MITNYKTLFINKFPSPLKEKLLSNEIEFPPETLYEYSKFPAFRGIVRNIDDTKPLCRDDMRSYAESGKKPRGVNENSASYYSVSLFLNKTMLEQALKFPRPHKKIAEVIVFQEGGPQSINTSTSHVDWWLYENVDFMESKILEATDG